MERIWKPLSFFYDFDKTIICLNTSFEEELNDK